MGRLGLGAVAALLLVAWLQGEARGDSYLRVIAQRAPVHTGPGSSYREIYSAERGEIFTVLERGTRGYWFRVKMEDGTTGWIFGELVFPYEVVDESEPGFFGRLWRGIRRKALGPSPVPYADVELSFSAGVIDREGVYLLRPAWMIDPHWAIELFAGLSPRQQKNIYLYGAGWTLRMAPGATVNPFVHAGVGGAYQEPKVDNFTEERSLFTAVAGGGFEITFKKQITLRLDYRNWILYDPDNFLSGMELTGGLAIFF